MVNQPDSVLLVILTLLALILIGFRWLRNDGFTPQNIRTLLPELDTVTQNAYKIVYNPLLDDDESPELTENDYES